MAHTRRAPSETGQQAPYLCHRYCRYPWHEGSPNVKCDAPAMTDVSSIMEYGDVTPKDFFMSF